LIIEIFVLFVIIYIFAVIVHITVVFEVLVDLGHIWVDKRDVLAKRVDDLGDHCRPAMRTGWLAYIKKTYSADAVRHGPALGQGELVVEDVE
jgi:hypothetical protein